MASETIAYFGYGSLVNLASLRTPYISAHRARLTGWGRTWLARPKVEGSFAAIDGLAFLSAEKSPRTTIEGLVIIDHRSSLASLDEREALYDRHTLQRSDVEFLDDDPLEAGADLFLYVAQPPAQKMKANILQSYLDVVMQGYHGHFGEAGVEAFVQTTSNFDCPILPDRDQPLYPRSVELSAEEITLYGSKLKG